MSAQIVGITAVALLFALVIIGAGYLIWSYVVHSNDSWDAVKKALNDYIQSTDVTQKELKAQLSVAQNAVMAEQSRYRELESAHEELQERYAKDLTTQKEKCLAHTVELENRLVDFRKGYDDMVEQYKKEVQEAREMRSDYRKRLCRLLECSETTGWEGLCNHLKNHIGQVQRVKNAAMLLMISDLHRDRDDLDSDVILEVSESDE